MSVQIIIDSASDITKAEAEEKGLLFMPMTMRINGVEYQSGVTITNEEFYNKLGECTELPTTGQITPFAFMEAYREALKEHDEVLAITMSGRLSGTVQSAIASAAECGGEVYVVDSENVTVGERVLVEYAVRLRDEGLSAKEMADRLNEAKKRICILGLVDTLEYLYKGGRLSRTSAIVGGILQIKPVLSVVEGELIVLGKARGSRQSNNYLNETIKKRGGIDFSMPYMLGYAGNDDALLRGYIDNSAEVWAESAGELPVCVVGSTIGSHTGPSLIAVAFFAKGE